MRTIAFHQSAFDQYNEWALKDKKTFERLRRLIQETARTPFAGIGKLSHLEGSSPDIGHAGLLTDIAWCTKSPTTNLSSPLASIIMNRALQLIRSQ